MVAIHWDNYGYGTGWIPRFRPNHYPQPGAKKKELESSSHPPEVQKIEAESQQLQIPGQPTLRPLEQGEVRFDF